MINRHAHARFLIAAALACSLAAAGAPAVGSGAGRDEASYASRKESRRQGPVVRAIARPARVRAGDLFTVEIAARGLRGAGAVAFHLLFDPTMLEPVPGGFTEGPFLRQAGAATSFMAASASTGERIMVGIARLGASEGARGSGTLCRLTFRAISPGTSTVAFDRASVTAPDGTASAARFAPALLRIEGTERTGKGR